MKEEIFNSFVQSVDRFSEILKEPKTVANRDSAIKRFELTFELAWKTLKRHLAGQGIVCGSPRDCFSEAFRLGLIADDPLWLKMAEDRNLSVHTYNEKLAENVYSHLKSYNKLFKQLADFLREG